MGIIDKFKSKSTAVKVLIVLALVVAAIIIF